MAGGIIEISVSLYFPQNRNGQLLYVITCLLVSVEDRPIAYRGRVSWGGAAPSVPRPLPQYFYFPRNVVSK